jgi:probable rRNA maturation factor
MVRIQILPQVRPVFPFSSCELKAWVENVGTVFGWKFGDIEILVASDRELAGKNTEFLGLPGPTNVLSFPLDMDPWTGLNGSVILSAHAVQREALLFGQKLREYCLRMLVHALLHLAGYEHGPAMEEMTGLCMQEILLGSYATNRDG